MRDAHAGAMKKVKKGQSYPGILRDDHPAHRSWEEY